MRFKTIAFALIVSSAVFILGCDDDDSSTIPGGGGQISLQVTINPPLDSSIVTAAAWTPDTNSAATTGDISTFAPATGFTTDAFAVTEGQEVDVILLVNGYGIKTLCSNIQVKALLNGVQFNARMFNMGGTSEQPPCPDGTQQLYTLTIP